MARSIRGYSADDEHKTSLKMPRTSTTERTPLIERVPVDEPRDRYPHTTVGSTNFARPISNQHLQNTAPPLLHHLPPQHPPPHPRHHLLLHRNRRAERSLRRPRHSAHQHPLSHLLLQQQQESAPPILALRQRPQIPRPPKDPPRNTLRRKSARMEQILHRRASPRGPKPQPSGMDARPLAVLGRAEFNRSV